MALRSCYLVRISVVYISVEAIYVSSGTILSELWMLRKDMGQALYVTDYIEFFVDVIPYY
jgi:hypothetical protein